MGLFSWNDGVQSYATLTETPRVEPDAPMRGAVVELLGGGALLCVQTDDDGVPLTPTSVTFSWPEWAPEDLLPIVEATYRNGRHVTVEYPWRGGTATITGRIPPGKWVEKSLPGKVSSLTVTVTEM